MTYRMSNARFGTNFETSFMPIYVQCAKCKNSWERAFIPNKRISCAKCKTSIIMPSQEEYNELKQKQTSDRHTKGTPMYSLPHSLLNDTKFSRALSWARTNGEDMLFYSDDEYRLSLVK